MNSDRRSPTAWRSLRPVARGTWLSSRPTTARRHQATPTSRARQQLRQWMRGRAAPSLESPPMDTTQRVYALLQRLVKEGALLEHPRVENTNTNGKTFIEVFAFMPKALYWNQDRRHQIYDDLERLGSATIHVQAHLYRK